MMDPTTGQGFDAVEVSSEEYFDPNATSEQWPGAVGLQIRVHHWWQGDVAWDTFDELGPTDQSITLSQGGPSQDGSSSGFTVAERTPSDFVPLLGVRQNNVVIELHGAYGFPSGGGDLD